MTGTVFTAHQVLLKDRRADALHSLSALKERMEIEMGANPVLTEALTEAALALQEATARLEAWCPELFGPQTPRFNDTECLCWRCTFDPFEGE